MSFLPSLRSNATLLDAFQAFPDISRPLIEFYDALLRTSMPLTEAERELIAACVSRLNRRGAHPRRP